MHESNPPNPPLAPSQQVTPDEPQRPEAAGRFTEAHPTRARSIRVVAALTRWLIAASAAISLTDLMRDSSGAGSMLTVETGTGSAWVLYLHDATAIVPEFLGALVFLVAAVCWLVWQYRAASSVRPGALRRGPGWQVGSWLIPIAMYWLPFQNIGDLSRASRARLSRGIRGAWWATWTVGNLCGALANVLSNRVDTFSEMRVALTVWTAADAIQIVAAVLAWIVIARITDAIAPRAARPPRPARCRAAAS